MNYPYFTNGLNNGFNFSPTPQAQTLVKVTGIEGAKAYQMPPNSVVALFDDTENIMFIKQTDGAGFPTIKTFSFTECEAVKEATNAEIGEIRAEIDDLKVEFDKLKAEMKKPVKKEKSEE